MADLQKVPSHDAPILRSMTRVIRSEAIEGDVWAITPKRKPTRKPRKSPANRVTLKRLITPGPGSKSKVSRLPRALTDRRMKKIQEFNDRNFADPNNTPFGGMGSDLWVSGLLKFMGSRHNRGLKEEDIRVWLEQSAHFFAWERTRLNMDWVPQPVTPPTPVPGTSEPAQKTETDLGQPSGSSGVTTKAVVTAVGEGNETLGEPTVKTEMGNSPKLPGPSGGIRKDDARDHHDDQAAVALPVAVPPITANGNVLEVPIPPITADGNVLEVPIPDQEMDAGDANPVAVKVECDPVVELDPNSEIHADLLFLNGANTPPVNLITAPQESQAPEAVAIPPIPRADDEPGKPNAEHDITDGEVPGTPGRGLCF